jgi:hypothetical protein
MVDKEHPQSSAATGDVDELRKKLPHYVSNWSREVAQEIWDDVTDEHPEARTYAIARWVDAITATQPQQSAESRDEVLREAREFLYQIGHDFPVNEAARRHAVEFADKMGGVIHALNQQQGALAPTDLNKVWGAAEACWASDAPQQCVDLLYYEILRLIRHPVTGFDINDVSAPSSPLSRPKGK